MATFEELQALNEHLKKANGEQPLFVPASPEVAAWVQHRDEVRQRWLARQQERERAKKNAGEGK